MGVVCRWDGGAGPVGTMSGVSSIPSSWEPALIPSPTTPALSALSALSRQSLVQVL